MHRLPARLIVREIAKQLTTPSEVTVEDVKGMIDALTAQMNAKIKSEKGKAGKKRMPHASRAD